MSETTTVMAPVPVTLGELAGPVGGEAADVEQLAGAWADALTNKRAAKAALVAATELEAAAWAAMVAARGAP